MNLVKKVAAVLAVLILIFGIAGCGNVKEKAGEEVQEKTSTAETSNEKMSDGKIFHAEDLVTMEEISTITGVPIVDIKHWDNDYTGLLGATYLVEKDGYDGFTLNCYQQSYRAAADDDVTHPVFGPEVKGDYEKRKRIVEESGSLEVVEGLGQEAYYDNVQYILYVLYNDEYYLEVRDNYFDDPATHKAMAIKIAEKAVERLSEKL